MKKMMFVLLGAAAMLFAVPETMAGHHDHHKGNDGLRLAAGIVNLVKEIIAPAPQVVYAPPAAVMAPPPPRVHRPEPPRKNHKPNRPAPKMQPKPQPGKGVHKR